MSDTSQPVSHAEDRITLLELEVLSARELLRREVSRTEATTSAADDAAAAPVEAAAVTQYRSRIAELLVQIEGLRRELLVRGRSESEALALNAQLARRAADAEQRAAAAEAQAESSARQARVIEQRAAAAVELAQQVAQLEDTLRDVLSSRSWRVTKPMRRVLWVLRRGRPHVR